MLQRCCGVEAAEGDTRKPRALGIASVRQGRRPENGG